MTQFDSRFSIRNFVSERSALISLHHLLLIFLLSGSLLPLCVNKQLAKITFQVQLVVMSKVRFNSFSLELCNESFISCVFVSRFSKKLTHNSGIQQNVFLLHSHLALFKDRRFKSRSNEKLILNIFLNCRSNFTRYSYLMNFYHLVVSKLSLVIWIFDEKNKLAKLNFDSIFNSIQQTSTVETKPSESGQQNSFFSTESFVSKFISISKLIYLIRQTWRICG